MHLISISNANANESTFFNNFFVLPKPDLKKTLYSTMLGMASLQNKNENPAVNKIS